MLRFGIYGYECTKKITYANVKIIPLYTTFKEANTLSKDNNAYNLTAFLEISKNNNTEMTLTETREVIHKLEAVLSFIDHRDVIISNQLRHNETYNNLEDDYPRKIETHVRKNGGGCVIINDTFCPKSRELFIEKTMTLLLSEDTPKQKHSERHFLKQLKFSELKKVL